jgi:hypothetical protein
MDLFSNRRAISASFRAECAGFFLCLSRFLRQTPAHAVEESLFDRTHSNFSTRGAILRTTKGGPANA